VDRGEERGERGQKRKGEIRGESEREREREREKRGSRQYKSYALWKERWVLTTTKCQYFISVIPEPLLQREKSPLKVPKKVLHLNRKPIEGFV
jgi:hypothetical protein